MKKSTKKLLSNYSKVFSLNLLNIPNTSYSKILSLIKTKPKTILDLGCSTGYFGKYLKDKYHSKVWGVETNIYDSNEAIKVLDHVVTINIENENNWHKIFQNTKFDLIICADILEHLQNPWLFVTRLKTLLSPKGNIICSIPNGTHYSIKLNVLSNSWRYDDIGLMDKTHFHFFSYEQIIKLFEDSKLYPKNIDFVMSYTPNQDILSGINKTGLDLNKKLVKNLLSFESRVFQYIISLSSIKPKKYLSYNSNSIKDKLLITPENFKPTNSEIIKYNNITDIKSDLLTSINNLLIYLRLKKTN